MEAASFEGRNRVSRVQMGLKSPLPFFERKLEHQVDKKTAAKKAIFLYRRKAEKGKKIILKFVCSLLHIFSDFDFCKVNQIA